MTGAVGFVFAKLDRLFLSLLFWVQEGIEKDVVAKFWKRKRSWPEFKSRDYDPRLAELYSQALVGMVALAGRWWLEVRKPRKETVAAHLVNLAWNGLSHLEPKPTLITRRR